MGALDVLALVLVVTRTVLSIQPATVEQYNGHGVKFTIPGQGHSRYESLRFIDVIIRNRPRPACNGPICWIFLYLLNNSCPYSEHTFVKEISPIALFMFFVIPSSFVNLQNSIEFSFLIWLKIININAN